MAEAKRTAFEKAVAAPTGRHLVLNTFGPAMLIGRGVQVKSDEPTTNPIGTDRFEYNIRVNASGTIDIQFRDDLGGTINVEMGDRVVTRFRITPTVLHIGASHSTEGDTLSQRFLLQEPEYGPATFRLVLLCSTTVRRVDVRYLN